MVRIDLEELHQQLSRVGDAELIERLLQFLTDAGQSNYDVGVTQTEHALQSAQLAAERDGGDEAITSALLHDIGHLVLDEHNAQGDFLEEDLNHEEVAWEFLRRYFPETITEPIRMHVVAKRYLCTTDPTYYERLSPASRRSFEVQGGRLSANERAALEKNPHLNAALELRRWDDEAKVAGRETPAIETFAPQLGRCLRRQ